MDGLRIWASAKMLKQAAINRQCGNIKMARALIGYATYFRTAKYPCLIRHEMDNEHARGFCA